MGYAKVVVSYGCLSTLLLPVGSIILETVDSESSVSFLVSHPQLKDEVQGGWDFKPIISPIGEKISISWPKEALK